MINLMEMTNSFFTAFHYKFSKPIFLISIFCLLLTTGCSRKSTHVDLSVAQQVALDSVALEEDEVTDLFTTEDGSTFCVKFSKGNGNYRILVSEDGKVIDYSYTGNVQKSDENPSNSKIIQNSSNDSDQEEQRTVVDETLIPRSELISRMAAFLGLSTYDESDFQTVSFSNDVIVLSVTLVGGQVLVAEMNPRTGEVYRTYSR